jgi:ribosomal protein L7Ae-like RNA K-turn-binding protein
VRRPIAAEAALRLLGLAARAGALLAGTERVRVAARAATLRFAIVAEDVSANSLDKLVPLLNARGIPYVRAFTREDLGAAVGKAPLSAIGITDETLSLRIRRELETSAEHGSQGDAQ